MTDFIKVENQSDEEIEIQTPAFGYYVSVDRKMFVLSDHPPDELGMSYVFQTYIANPGDHDWKQQLFLVGMDHFGTRFLCWAKGAEDAVEIAAEAALEAGMKGFFTSDEEMKELYDEARAELGPDVDDEEVQQQAEADLTYTESGWITAYEWSIDDVHQGQAFGEGQDLYTAAKFVCEAYTDDSDEVRFELVPNGRARRQVPPSRASSHYDDYIITVPRMSAQRRLVYAYNAENDGWGSMIGLARGYDTEREAFDWAHRHAVQRGVQDAVVVREKHDGSVVQVGNVGESHRGGPQYNANARGELPGGMPPGWRIGHRTPDSQSYTWSPATGHDYIIEENSLRRGEWRLAYAAPGARMYEWLPRKKANSPHAFDAAEEAVQDWKRRSGLQLVKNARLGDLPAKSTAQVDQHAATELELYIENDFALVGADNSKGKMIEKNLDKKIKQGKYDFSLSVKLWEYLIEDGAKKYAEEMADAKDWYRIFSPATRRYVAERFAHDFAQQRGVA